LLVVYLVGETATAGVHKVALRNALDEMTELESSIGRPDWATRGLQIMGPTFSGSAFSLALTLHGWMDSLRGTLPKIRVLSGSATAIDPCVFRGWTGHPENVEYKATVVRDRDALRAFIRYLTDTLGAVNASSPHPQIALLSEANTAYGQSASELGSRRTSNLQPRPSPTPASGFSCPPEKEPDWSPPVILNLTFPLHVSQLRSEIEKANAERTGKSDDRVVITHDDVPLPKGERAQREVEVVPPFSPLDAAYSDLVLSKLLTEIQHEPIRYVCLVATDVLDRIFLVERYASTVPMSSSTLSIQICCTSIPRPTSNSSVPFSFRPIRSSIRIRPGHSRSGATATDISLRTAPLRAATTRRSRFSI
jgi:hypothetical protein